MGTFYETMKNTTGIFLLVLICVEICSVCCEAEPIEQTDEAVNARDSRVLPVFQVVKFPNDICAGSTLNGTCYTAEECSSLGGSSDGSCASGFGVCCTFTLSCGGSSSQNQTYITQASVTTLTSPCTYTICPVSTDICRIRYDFTTFVISNMVTASVEISSNTAVPAENLLKEQMTGDCVDDQFSITGGMGVGTPIICGTNTGYHMILDTDGSTCQYANFNIGGITSVTRSWDIRVSQYTCGQEDLGGPPGCLQYYTATSSTIANFGFPPTATSVTLSVTHLSNQNYDICVRRGSGFCYICYTPALNANPVQAAAAITEANAAISGQRSFGLSVSSSATDIGSMISTTCSLDYINIPGATTATIAAITNPAAINVYGSRLCGRFFGPTQGLLINNAIAENRSVCSRVTPFRVSVHFDNNEQNTATAADMATLNEFQGGPGGIIGFKLHYWQVSC